MTSIESATSDMETTLSTNEFTTGIPNLWVPQFGWADGNEGAGEDPFAQQYLAALEIMAWMFGTSNKCWIHIAAEMQAGKTGVINALIRLILIPSNFKKIQISPQNVFIITGMNDNAWKKQTKDRMPKDIHQNIHHLNGLKHVRLAMDKKASTSGFKNILVVLDESHIASAISNTPSREVFNQMRELCPVENWAENNIRLITISATDPAAVIGCGDFVSMARVVHLRTSEAYQSVEKLRDQNRLHDTFNLKTEKDIEKLVNIIKDKFSETPNLYHIIRVPRVKDGCLEAHLRKLVLGCNVISWDSKSNAKALDEASSSGSQLVDDINEILENEPNVPTFILIKNMFYAAKSLDDQYCGVLFDRSSSKDDTNCQSLLGRACGYGHSSRTHIYTNLQTVRRYIEIWSKLKPTDDMIIPIYDPKMLTRKMAGIMASSHTNGVQITVSPRRAIPMTACIDGGSSGGRPLLHKVQASEDNFDSIWSDWFDNEDECNKWWGNNGGRPQKLKRNSDGFVLCSAQKSGVLDVVDIEKIRSGKKTANSSKTPDKMKIGEKAFRRYGAYIDVNDNTTVRFCVHIIIRKS
jgi:hypothetical protein